MKRAIVIWLAILIIMSGIVGFVYTSTGTDSIYGETPEEELICYHYENDGTIKGSGPSSVIITGATEPFPVDAGAKIAVITVSSDKNIDLYIKDPCDTIVESSATAETTETIEITNPSPAGEWAAWITHYSNESQPLNSADYHIIIDVYYYFVGFTFFPSTPTILDNTHFTAVSYANIGNIENWTWAFGDGKVGYGKNITHQYVTKGKYTISLKATYENGSEEEYTKDILIHNLSPTAVIFATPLIVEIGDTVTFDASESYDIDGNVTGYYFDFGDGETTGWGADFSKSHLYTTTGVYNVTLKVKDDDDVTATDTVTIKVTKVKEPKGFIPGFETTTLLIAMLGVCAILLKRRQKSRDTSWKEYQ